MKTLVLVALCLLVAPLAKVKLTQPQTFAEFWPNGTARAVRETIRDLDDELVSHGLYRTFHENGQREIEGQYRQGQRHGLWIWYYPTGEKQAECDFQDGVGAFTAFYPSGEVLRTGTYTERGREGLWTEYFRSGAKRMEGPYVANEQHGRWSYWLEGESEPQLTIDWEHGQRKDGGAP